MSCTNCFNGCTETVSDQCIKYTGNDIPTLGILHGDTLLSVENAITSFLTTILTGESIKPTIDPTIICSLVSSNLPTCTQCDGISLNDIITALIKSTCSLQTQINVVNQTLTTLNSPYTVGCLTGITNTSNTHEVLQTVITKLCTIDNAFTQLLIDLPDTYVSINSSPGIPGINDYIEAYINSIPGQDLYSARMIPYVAVPYFGDLTPFDLTGAGQGNWDRIFLCNGENPGVPDLRGRALVGTTTMGTNPFNPAVDPGIAGNPTYNLNTLYGANTITLTPPQIPAHTHPATGVINPASHSHSYIKTNNPFGPSEGIDIGYNGVGDEEHIGGSAATTGETALTVDITVANNTLAGNPHGNVQPVHACYYIIYIP